MSVEQTPVPNAVGMPPKRPASLPRKIWRVIYWGTILAGAWGIILMLRRAPAPPVTMSAQAALSAEQKLSKLAEPEAPSLSTRGPERIALTEEEVNSFLAERVLAGGGASGAQPPMGQGIGSVRDLRVTFSGDRARIFGLFSLAGKDMTLEMEGRLHVVDGYVRFEPTGGSLGDLAMPPSALDAVISRIMNSPETRESFRMPAWIRDVRVENGELVIDRQ